MGYFSWMFAHWGEVVEIIAMAIGAFSLFAKLTPSKADNVLADKLLGVVNSLALNPRATKARK